ncbi:hypothetical protein SRHO_G00042090 [Serrasalmus rhombeus]
MRKTERSPRMKQPVPETLLTFLLWACDTWPELQADLQGPAPDPPPDPPLHVAFITKHVHPKALHTHGKCQLDFDIKSMVYLKAKLMETKKRVSWTEKWEGEQPSFQKHPTAICSPNKMAASQNRAQPPSYLPVPAPTLAPKR